MRRKLLTVSNQLLTLEKFSGFLYNYLSFSCHNPKSTAENIARSSAEPPQRDTDKYFTPDPISTLISYIKCIIFCTMVRNVEDKEEMINVISSGRLGLLRILPKRLAASRQINIESQAIFPKCSVDPSRKDFVHSAA